MTAKELTDKVVVPQWVMVIVVGALVGSVVTGMGYQIVVNREDAVTRAEVKALRDRMDKDESELIGVKRFEDFEKHVDERLDAIHDEVSGVIIYKPLSKAPRLPGEHKR